MPNPLNRFTNCSSLPDASDSFPADLYSKLINSRTKSLQHFNDDEISVGNKQVAKRLKSMAKKIGGFPAEFSQVKESLDVRR